MIEAGRARPLRPRAKRRRGALGLGRLRGQPRDDSRAESFREEAARRRRLAAPRVSVESGIRGT